MTVNKSMIDNFECKEGSFLYCLHELAEFNEIAFWQYHDSIIELTKTTKDNPNIDRNTLDMVCSTYDYALRSFMWHFDPGDIYSISNMPKDNLYLYVERLEFAFNGFIRGKVFEDGIFELQHPILETQQKEA